MNFSPKFVAFWKIHRLEAIVILKMLFGGLCSKGTKHLRIMGF